MDVQIKYDHLTKFFKFYNTNNFLVERKKLK